MRTLQAEGMAAATVAFFENASKDPVLCERLAFADTTVHVHITDGHEGCGYTLLLDRVPIQAELGCVGKAEIQLSAPAAVFADMVDGTNHLAMSIADGETTYRGPVRKFLRIVPILRGFDSSPIQEALGGTVETGARG